MFFTLVLSGMLLMSVYVGWRAGSVPALAKRLPWWARAVLLAILGSSYVGARNAEALGWTAAARALEAVGAYWIGILLLLFVALLAADLLTGFGLLFRTRLTSIRGAALLTGLALSALAIVQAVRPPAVRDHELRLPGLPLERDGTVLVFISDLHLGSMLGKEWLTARLAQIAGLHPHAILIGGDLLEGDSPSERDLLPLIGRLSAPLGVWAVPGNHERHGGGSTMAALEGLGIRTLGNEWREAAPGLIFAGVDGARERDAHGQDGSPATQASGPAAPRTNAVTQALSGRPAAAATVLVSHAPSRVEDAARAGVGLMLAGHTHDGQIWPFRYLVRTQFAYLAGRYSVSGMALVVCRGTGTFGPRMRLWHPSEILRITLRSGVPRAGASPGRP